MAFALLVGSVWAQARGNLESSLQLVWLSIGLSALAMGCAAASVLLRRPRDERPSGPSQAGGQAEAG